MRNFLNKKTTEIIVDGKATKEDSEQVTGQLHKFNETHGIIKFLEVIQNFKGFDLSVIWDGIKFDM